MDKKNQNNKNPELNKKKNNKKKKSKTKWIFLGIVLFLYVILYFSNQDKTTFAITYSLNLIKSIIPILSLVLIFMVLFNLINENKLKKLIEKSPKFIQYFIMAIFGTFSHGPIYAWYPLMKDFHNKGISYGSIATFLYARGIKLTFLPVLISYFGFAFTVILTTYMLIFSYIQGIIVDLILIESISE